ncbi:hypothetical protein M2347_000956 [Chryseobacterium sp. H1D6B]|uniref:DUF3667 domain-containing protein n=1 Tax=Chryseobacterium sp. H1D6B TaxID=2940588 RepID=UPI0015C71668|nr:DUF3667 domain-containing protein [Chryseobacterium sp. H1D6B]MDH6251229.1 hypothetical protein [Chryseobacterium sp. H1D6B]
MSHGKIREEKNCLNCGHLVEERFCPHCGQENIETRQPFYYLFTHFIEDFTHYDGQFWKTIKYLLFRPGKLTKEYASGKRQIYVAPVKLYIFISFITFLLPAFIPDYDTKKMEENKHSATEQEEKIKQEINKLQKANQLPKTAQITTDTLQNKNSKKNIDIGIDNEDQFIESAFTDNNVILGAKNLKQYDSLHTVTGKSYYTYLRPYAKKNFELKEKGYTQKEIQERFRETFIHTLPKALFVYLPIFAFFLWLFHNKKKWWYFDHGIFTLHYFSFLLLSILMYIILERITSLLPDYTILDILSFLAYTALFLYMCTYFFIAHHRVYETRKSMSILTGISLFIVNLAGLLLMLIILFYLSFIMLH